MLILFLLVAVIVFAALGVFLIRNGQHPSGWMLVAIAVTLVWLKVP